MAKKKKVVRDPQFDSFKNGVKNGLNDIIMGFNPGSLGTPLNSLNTLWINNRWYLASNMRQLLSESYVEHGIIQTICGVPVEDAFRGGIDIHTTELEPSDIEELQMDMQEHNDLGSLMQARVWNRLFGGAGLIIMNGDDDLTSEFRIDSIKEGDPIEFKSADMWELFWNAQNTEEYFSSMDGNALDVVENFNYYGRKLHNSRVMKMRGIEAPSFIRPRLRGWGTSVVEVLINSLNQYLKSNNLIFEVLDEFKVDYYGIKNLTTSLANPSAQANITKRIALTNKQKNYNHAVVMDKEDTWQQRQLTFAGIAETMVGIRMQIASDLRMPLTKVFGISASGFSSGEDDIENYNAMVESSIRQPSKFEVLKIVKIRMMQKYGFVPKDLKCTFKPLRILSSEQEENVKTQKHSRLLASRTAGEVTSKEFREACNKDQLLPIQLEVDDSAIKELEKEKEAKAESEAAPAAGTKSIIQAKEAKT